MITRLLTTLAAILLLLSPVASRQLVPIHVGAGEDLQHALDTAAPGDLILLAPGARFTGSFVLPAGHDSEAFITIRTDGPGLPPPGTRVSPAAAASFATIQSQTSEPALRTAPGAHHWRIEGVTFGPTKSGTGAIIELGDGNQRSLDLVPHDLVLDRVYIHGDPLSGQKRGIALNSGAAEIRNSYIADIKAVGIDTQAIAGWNGPGPYLIENNYLEAAGENVMFGGADPVVDGLVPSHIVVRRNLVARPLAWRDPLLAAPASAHAEASAAHGTLAAGTYTYVVIAERPVAGGATASSAASPRASVGVTRSDGVVELGWEAVPGATAYRIFRTDDAGAIVWWRVAQPSFTDRGTPGTPGQVPAPTVWTVKNLFELKNASDVTIDGNVFEHHWRQAQPGYAIVFTPRNQDGHAPWSRVDQVRFTNNVVRHVSSVFNILGEDDLHPSGPGRDLVIENNLFVDVDGHAWGGGGDFLQMGAGAASVHVERNTVQQTGRIAFVYGKQPFAGFIFRGNVVRHNAYGVMGDNASPGTLTFSRYLPGVVFVGNVIAGGPRAKYPEGNDFVADDAFDRLFEDAPGGNFRRRDPGAGADLDRIDAAIGAVRP